MKTLGVCLSGGAAKGIAHIGVLQVLKEHNIPITAFSGTSFGSIVATLASNGYSPLEILDLIKGVKLWQLLSVENRRLKTSLKFLERELERCLRVKQMEDLPLPLFISLLNVDHGTTEIFSEGYLPKIVTSACSVLGLFYPQKINGINYADGGLLNCLPVEPLRPLVDVTLGVNVQPFPKTEGKDYKKIIDMAKQRFNIIVNANIQASKQYCDLILEPNTLPYKFQNVKAYQELYQLGYDTALEQLPQLKKLLELE